jgi:hypothetical protein
VCECGGPVGLVVGGVFAVQVDWFRKLMGGFERARHDDFQSKRCLVVRGIEFVVLLTTSCD